MSELLQIPGSALSDEPRAPQPPTRTTRHLLSAFSSAIVPGVGQLLLGQRRKAILLLVSFTVLLICFWPLRLLRFYAGFCLLFSAWIVLYLYAACSAQLSRAFPGSVRPSNWWLAATLPIFILNLSLLGGVVTRASGFRSFGIPSTSMESTIQRGDHIVVDIRSFDSRPPLSQDVIVFKRDRTFFIKRVLAVGGETIESRNGRVLINGFAVNEPYVQHNDSNRPDWMNTFGPVEVPNGKYFVLGDNRDVSLDSRSSQFGLVDRATIVGKALYVFGTDRDGTTIR